MVYYLKYRPQKLADLDLPEIRSRLTKLAQGGKFPHALLFTGPRGSGKTSAARIVAKAVDCEKNKGRGEPCNKCSVCREIVLGSFIDLIEIDGASNRGIDDIRTLRENIKLAPSRGRKKVYIIDEVHMLTTEAFNALLKTLEEPPAHALFILCTTEPEKLPATITSRCTQFHFRKAKPKEIQQALERVIKGEELVLEKGVLDLISQKVDGSFRDAKKILEQLVTKDNRVTLSETKKLLGEIETLSPLSLLKALAQKDAVQALAEINRLAEAGADLKVYMQNFLESLRQILMSRLGINGFQEPEELRALDLRMIKLLLRKFSQAMFELKNAVIPQLPLELAVVESLEISEKKTPENDNNKPVKKEVIKNPVPKNGNGETNIALVAVKDQWSEILSRVKPLNHSVGALLRSCQPFELDGEVLTLKVFYRFHKERLETEKCRLIVEQAAAGVLGIPVRLKCVLSEKKSDNLQIPSKTKEVVGNHASADVLTAAEQIFNGKIVD